MVIFDLFRPCPATFGKQFLEEKLVVLYEMYSEKQIYLLAVTDKNYVDGRFLLKNFFSLLEEEIWSHKRKPGMILVRKQSN
jgi:hypothetical protein